MHACTHACMHAHTQHVRACIHTTLILMFLCCHSWRQSPCRKCTCLLWYFFSSLSGQNCYQSIP